jgi:hypothetical protein
LLVNELVVTKIPFGALGRLGARAPANFCVRSWPIVLSGAYADTKSRDHTKVFQVKEKEGQKWKRKTVV